MNRKTISGTILSFFILFSLTSCMTMQNNPDYKPKALDITENSTVVCFGDSLTYGNGANPETESWPAIIQQKIKIPVVNAGINDNTTYDAVQRFQKDVLDNNPAILIFDFGGNDIYEPGKHQSYSEIERNFRTMLNQINFDNTQVFIMRFFNDEMRFLDLFGNFDNILLRLERDYDVIIIWDAWSGAWGHPDCKYDMTHCNAKGYKIMAANIFTMLEPCLRENDLLRY